MALNYLLKLTPKEITREVIVQMCVECGRVKETKQEPIRDLEIGMLTLCFNMASTAKRDVKGAMLCYDCISQLENLSDDENEIEFTKKDLELFEEGYSLTAGMNEKGQVKRPFAWLEKCNGLLKQIVEPKTREEWAEVLNKIK